MKAIIYSRISTSNQSNNRQVNDLKEEEGFEVVKTFTESISGFTKSVEERPELQKAIKYAVDNDVKVLLVHEISRLGRRTAEVLFLLDKLKSYGIKIFIQNLGLLINGNDKMEASNKLIITMMTDLARMESETLSYRIKSGLQERKRKGLTIGRRYGTVESGELFISKYKNVIKYLDKGESIRWIATKLKMSPTTVQKVKKAYLAGS